MGESFDFEQSVSTLQSGAKIERLHWEEPVTVEFDFSAAQMPTSAHLGAESTGSS